MRMRSKIFSGFCALLIAFVAGCGGGSQTPVNTSWNVKLAYRDLILYAASATYQFKVTGTVNQQQVSGTGFITFNPYVTTSAVDSLPGQTVYQQDATIQAVYAVSGSYDQTLAKSKISSWYSMLYGSLGESHTCPGQCGDGIVQSEYIVLGTSNALPVNAVSGASGSLYQGVTYSDSPPSSANVSGSVSATYAITAAANAGNANLVITVIESDKSNRQVSKRVMTYLVDPTDNATLTGMTFTDGSKELIFYK